MALLLFGFIAGKTRIERRSCSNSAAVGFASQLTREFVGASRSWERPRRYAHLAALTLLLSLGNRSRDASQMHGHSPQTHKALRGVIGLELRAWRAAPPESIGACALREYFTAAPQFYREWPCASESRDGIAAREGVGCTASGSQRSAARRGIRASFGARIGRGCYQGHRFRYARGRSSENRDRVSRSSTGRQLTGGEERDVGILTKCQGCRRAHGGA